MSLWLTPAEVTELTGYKHRGKQVRWLQREGIFHYVREDGSPVVPVSALAEVRVTAGPAPNFDAIQGTH